MADISSETTDAELVAGIRANDVEAFRTLYYRYYDGLVRFLWGRVPVSEQVYDMVQEAFTRLWQHRGSLDPDRSVRAYLYRTAHNLATDHLRRAERENHYLHEMFTALPPSEPFSEDAFELRDRLQSAIRALPEPLKLVFTLSRFEACTYDEIAEVAGISVKGVEKRMSQALRRLRESLRPLLAVAFVVWFF